MEKYYMCPELTCSNHGSDECLSCPYSQEIDEDTYHELIKDEAKFREAENAIVLDDEDWSDVGFQCDPDDDDEDIDLEQDLSKIDWSWTKTDEFGNRWII
jgi:hypothetical protein